MKIYTDPYVDRDTGVLKNKQGIKAGQTLKKWKLIISVSV